jgi:VIT1/CCC1 family predicted Fe2+/Mn2+ transporter
VALPEKDFDHDNVTLNKLNWLRAAVLGADDGIISVSSIILGVAGATSNLGTIFTAGMAGLAAGALSMAAGEYVSVSSQRDTQRAFIAEEKDHLKIHPKEEFAELIAMYEDKGLSAVTAQQVAHELTNHDVLGAHIDLEMGTSVDNLANPWQAAIASLLAFTIGGLIPLITIVVASHRVYIAATVIAVLVALCITGYLSAVVSNSSRLKVMIRIIVGGALAMAITYTIGRLFGGIVH